MPTVRLDAVIVAVVVVALLSAISVQFAPSVLYCHLVMESLDGALHDSVMVSLVAFGMTTSAADPCALTRSRHPVMLVSAGSVHERATALVWRSAPRPAGAAGSAAVAVGVAETSAEAAPVVPLSDTARTWKSYDTPLVRLPTCKATVVADPTTPADQPRRPVVGQLSEFCFVRYW